MEKKLDMGPNSSRAFAGELFSPTGHLIYTESPSFLADLIKKNFSPDRRYTLADLGSASGELVENIIKLLPEYHFNITAFDVSESAILKNQVAQTKLVGDLTELPCGDKEFDLSIMRYVLQWNTIEDQIKIIKEIARITKGIALVQHVGADLENKNEWREASMRMFTHPHIPKLHRDFYFFTPCEEIEEIYKQNNIKFKRVQYRKIERLADVFVERFNITIEEGELARAALGNYNYIIQSAWLLDFRN